MKAFLIFLFLLVGCTASVESEDPMKNLIAAQIADMLRTPASGSTSGLPAPASQQPSLQKDNLEPGEYTIQFQAFPPADGLGFAAYAIINWKIAGQQITRKVSVANGISISGIAEAVDVTLFDVSQVLTVHYPPTALPYKIGVSLSKGTRPNIQQPASLVTNLSAIPVAAGAPVFFTVPDNAGVVSALVLGAGVSNINPVLPPDIVVSQVNSLGAVLNVWNPAQQGQWIPLSPGTTLLKIDNQNALQAAFVNVIWGIDG